MFTIKWIVSLSFVKFLGIEDLPRIEQNNERFIQRSEV
jgi:hypothetical protein